jgi:ferredoxin-NADP reductase/predicted pyridoxine 5'-phosphate oxidase superfamily flavin-nucleotide-binding protein
MTHHYYRHAFTPSVLSIQEQDGSRSHYQRAGASGHPNPILGQEEREFIQDADHFYQATVGETGWPYVQHRGGAPGFLKVLDENTIAFPDFQGNRQYISVGNLAMNNRISIIIMDYVRKRRLKLLGWVELRQLADDPSLAEQLRSDQPSLNAQRAFVIKIAGFDWNCPQHIVQRYTRLSVEKAMAQLREEIAELRAQQPASRTKVLGSGPLRLEIAAIRLLTANTRAYTLRRADGGQLPEATAGSSLAIPVEMPNGEVVLRHYSLMEAGPQHKEWEIAVQLAKGGRGGSAAVHASWQLGQQFHCALPTNHFALHPDSRPALLLAAGIGVTPLRAMAQSLLRHQRSFTLLLTARGKAEAPYLEELRATLDTHLVFHDSSSAGRLNADSLLKSVPVDCVIYACGPESFLADIDRAAKQYGHAIVVERFTAPSQQPDARPVRLRLARSNRTIEAPAGTTLLEVLEKEKVAVASACRTGQCGTCVVKVLEGTPEHHDHVLTEEEKASGKKICLCVSRALSNELVLDL